MTEEKEKKKLPYAVETRKEVEKLRKDLIHAQKEIAHIKNVLKDAHLMSLDD